MNILKLLQTLSTGDVVLIAALILSAIQIAPIRIDPWTAIIRWIGKIMIGDLPARIAALEKNMADRISGVEKKLGEVEAKEDERDAVNKRVRILRFEDELQEERRHSKDSFDQVLSDISGYNQYCEEHPNFKNEQTAATVTHIRKIYAERLEKRDFL